LILVVLVFVEEQVYQLHAQTAVPAHRDFKEKALTGSVDNHLYPIMVVVVQAVVTLGVTVREELVAEVVDMRPMAVVETEARGEMQVLEVEVTFMELQICLPRSIWDLAEAAEEVMISEV
jgi:hypothetical protein